MFHPPTPLHHSSPLPTNQWDDSHYLCCFCRAIDGCVSSAGIFQAHWRGVSLRRRLAAALAAVTLPPDLEEEEEEEELLEELDTVAFILDEVRASEYICVRHVSANDTLTRFI